MLIEVRKLLILIAIPLLFHGCVEVDSVGPYYPNTITSTTELYIYGGKNADVFLGILNASKSRTESIWNQFGTYGNRYSSKSIWNPFGDYGYEHSNFCPFNKFASYPPELRDKNGKFYGFFTCNIYEPNRAKYDVIDEICEHYQEIREDVSGWYDRIFY